MIPYDPANLIDSRKGYDWEAQDVKPMVDYWYPRLASMTPQQLQDLLVTIWIQGKED